MVTCEGRGMLTRSLGKTLVIANPAAHSGKGEAAALFATRFFSSFQSATSSCEVRLTEGTGDAIGMAAGAATYDHIIALGGDGVIHEVINGLMQIPQESRPCLGVIPMGSGNDFARTLSMPKNDPEKALAELLGGRERVIDLGRVNDAYFMETLSFGLDAAIAHDTTKRRANKTKQAGALLFATSGLKLFSTGMRGWEYDATIDSAPERGIGVVFAVQNGPTYGGGFRVCPTANPVDGMLDLCYTRTRPSILRALALFGLARFGRHTKSRRVNMRKVRTVQISFPGSDQPPCQIDGEVLQAESYSIRVVPKALRVLVGNECKW